MFRFALGQAELEGAYRQETEKDGSRIQRTLVATWTKMSPLSQQQTPAV
jgi:hypothetical protein